MDIDLIKNMQRGLNSKMNTFLPRVKTCLAEAAFKESIASFAQLLRRAQDIKDTRDKSTGNEPGIAS